VKLDVQYHCGSAVDLQALGVGEVGEVDEAGGVAVLSVRVFQVDRPALILGSAQSTSIVDGLACARLGVEVGRRRTGGGAVLVVPGEMLWVDVVVPTSAPQYVDDIRLMAQWVGTAWVSAIDAGTVHTGGLEADVLGSLVCFAGVGPGEVSIDGRKVVGISQRRTRHWVRLQTAVLGRWDPAAVVAVLHLDDPAAALAELSRRAGSVPIAGLAERFVDVLANRR
jgi:lipoate---protein ligase